MENSQAHPVPATEEVKEKLPREVLEEGCKCSPLLYFPSVINMLWYHSRLIG